MKDFSMSSMRVGDTILDGLRLPHPVGIGKVDFYAAQHLSRLVADLVNDLDAACQEKARLEVKRLYTLGLDSRK